MGTMTQDRGSPGRPALGVNETVLTVRERETLELIAGGMSNQEIAEALGISINTVKTFVRVLYTKIGARSRVQAVLYWQQQYSDAQGEGQGDALTRARRTVAEMLTSNRAGPSPVPPVPVPGRHVPAPTIPIALEDHLRRDLKSGTPVVHDLPDSDLGRVSALLECARAIAASGDQPIRMETTFVPHGRVLVRIAMGKPKGAHDALVEE